MLSNKENLLRAILHDHPHHVPYLGEGACKLVDCRGRKPPRSGVDEWGVTWSPLPESYQVGVEEPLESYASAYPGQHPADLLQLPLPDGSDPARFAGILHGVDLDTTLVIGQHPAGPLDLYSSLLGMHSALSSMISQPDDTLAVLSRITDFHVGIAKGYLAAGAEAGFIADDYAGGEGPFLRPATWRAMILPGLRRIMAVYRDAGAPVFFHTCGKSDVFIADLLDAGASVLNLQSSCCDLTALKQKYGARITFYGGISSHVMALGSEEEVRKATADAIRSLAADGGLILGPDQPLSYPSQNLEAFLETAQRLGIYPQA